MSPVPRRVVHVTTVHPRDDIRIFRKECVSLARAGYEVVQVVGDGQGREGKTHKSTHETTLRTGLGQVNRARHELAGDRGGILARIRAAGGGTWHGVPPSPHDTSAGKINVATCRWRAAAMASAASRHSSVVLFEVRTKPGDTLRATVSISDCNCASYLT